jgi:hypothetical protein
MRIYNFLLLLLINSLPLFSQEKLIIEGTIVNNTESGVWEGENIPRSIPTKFIYRNNSITCINSSGYIIQAGDENVDSQNNNLDGEIITGNKITWNGIDMASFCHGVFTGYNINAVLKYNYLDKVPLGLIRKANGMTNTSGGIAYNIINNPLAVGAVAKGINNVCFYNNTFYSERTRYTKPGNGTWRGLIDVYSNTDITPGPASTGAKIKNNIFYTKNQIYNIYIYDTACLAGFESDFNVFYCEAGTPVFNYLGSYKTFAQWQALGYDTHSVVVNPRFIDFTNFVPERGLYTGTDLGEEFKTGLSTNATWVAGTAPATSDQGSSWQVGARIYDTFNPVPDYIRLLLQLLIMK